jgi:hypothetical protein
VNCRRRGHIRWPELPLQIRYEEIKEAAGRGRLETAMILQNFVEVLSILQRKEMPLGTGFQIEEILSIASQALADRRT